MQKFRKKPVVVEAWQWDDQIIDEWPAYIKDYTGEDSRRVFRLADIGHKLVIPTLEGDHTANRGDWIIRGVRGELYPCKPAIFEATYEPVDD